MKKLTAAVLTILVICLSISNAAAKPANDPEPKHSFDYPIPEPATLLILTLGAIMIKRKR